MAIMNTYISLFIHSLLITSVSAFSKLPAASTSTTSICNSNSRRSIRPSFRTMTTTSRSASRSEGTTSDNEKLIHWGIVGLGDVCAIKSGPPLYKCHGSTISAVMRRSPGAAQAWIDEHSSTLPADVANSIRAFDSVEQMMNEMGDQLDVIYVASPPGAHLENVRQIVQHHATNSSNDNKLKAIYVEKPCGRCAWETRAMIDECQIRNIQFFPAYVSRAHERTQVLRKMLSQDQTIGDTVTSIKYTQRGSSLARGLTAETGGDGSISNIPWRLVGSRSGGGLIMDMGCHVLDRIDYLFGPLKDVKSKVLCKGGGYLVEDYVEMTATVGNCDWSAISSAKAKVQCVWDFSPNDSEEVDELMITGSKGSLRMGGMGPGLPIEVLDTNGKVIDKIEFRAPMHSAQALIQSIVNELLEVEGVSKSPARAENALRTSEVLDAILGSYYGGRHDEFWTRSDTWPGLKG